SPIRRTARGAKGFTTMDSSGVLGSQTDVVRAQVERAIAEFRASRPVLITSPGHHVLAFGVDGIDVRAATAAADLATVAPHLLLPAARLRRLGLDRTAPGRIALPTI